MKVNEALVARYGHEAEVRTGVAVNSSINQQFLKERREITEEWPPLQNGQSLLSLLLFITNATQTMAP